MTVTSARGIRLRSLKTDKDLSHLMPLDKPLDRKWTHTQFRTGKKYSSKCATTKMPTVSSSLNILNSLNILLHFSTCYILLYCWHVLLMLLSSFALLHFAETRERTECGQGATSPTSSWASWAWSSCLAAACTIDTNLNILNQSAQFCAQIVKSCTNGTNGILCFLITLVRTYGWDDHGGHRNLKSNRSCQSKPWSAHRIPMSSQQFWNCLEASGRIQLGLQLFHCLPAPKLIKKRT